MGYRLQRLLWLVVVLVFIAGCGSGGGGGKGPLPNNPDSSIDSFLARYVQLTKSRNSQGLANMYTDPSEWTDPTGTRTYSRAEVRALFDTTFAIVTTVYDSQAKDVTATVSGNTAVLQFTWVQDVYNSALDQRVKSEGHMTWTLQRINGEWYIAKALS